MEIREVKEQKIWDDFTTSFEMSQFLHSWQWGLFQENLGHKIFRLGVYQNDKIIGTLMLIKNKLLLNKSYLYSPRLPILTEAIPAEIFIEKIKEISKKECVIFWRVDLFNEQIFKTIKLKRVGDVQPSKIILLDLTKSEQEILSAMHPKTRYNIHLAEKKGIKIRLANTKEDFDNFLKLIDQTSKRDKFISHQHGHYKKLLELDKNFVKLYLAEYQGKILAANLMIYFGDTCTYLHGASSDEHKNLMAPHLLYWQCIKDAQNQGYKYYDFWGIDEKKWPGVTRFKRSFVSSKTSHEISYPGTFDLPLDKKWYWLYSLAKKFI